MSIAFVYHLLITSIIFYILSTGFKFFLKLRLSIDFSYVGIVLFASYTAAILNTRYWLGMLSTSLIAWLWSIVFTILVLYLSRRLSQVYFVVWTLALYMLMFQLAINRQSLTGGSFGISGINRTFTANIHLNSLSSYLSMAGIVCILLLSLLRWFKKTYLYTLLKGRGENETILKALWTYTARYTFVLILLTSLCAVAGGTLYTFYYLYIDPQSFWLNMLILLLVISFISYKHDEFVTFITAVCVIFGYEYLRFFKIVDPSLLWYVRESLFALIIMGIAFITFRYTTFSRQQ